MADITSIKHRSTTYDLKDSTARTDAAAAANDAAAAMEAAATAGATATWGSVSGTISNQTDLTSYINQLISQGASGMLGRPNYSAGIAFTASKSGNNYQSPTYSDFTVPANGFIKFDSILSSTTGTSGNSYDLFCYINGVKFPLGKYFNTSSGIALIDGPLIPVSAGDVVRSEGTWSNTTFSSNFWSGTLTGVFYPQK